MNELFRSYAAVLHSWVHCYKDLATTSPFWLNKFGENISAAQGKILLTKHQPHRGNIFVAKEITVKKAPSGRYKI